jgi:hypothetical protein
MSKSEKELFYEECAKILGVEHTYLVPYAAYSDQIVGITERLGMGALKGAVVL